MVAVIADDLTGAAELGGIGLKYNLNVEIAVEVNPESKADLLIVATSARSKSQEEAVAEMTRATKEVAKLNPEIIFKKVDSVLRGHIVPEIKAQLEVLNLKRALLIPANPALGRTVTNGYYYIYGKPIAQTDFSNDPEFSIKESDVLKMLRDDNGFVKVQKREDPLPAEGIVIGEVACIEDLPLWVRKADEQTFIAGGSGFFSALFDSFKIKSRKVKKSRVKTVGSTLLISGTAFNRNAALIKEVYNQNGPVSYMPQAITRSNPEEKDFDNWCSEITNLIRNKNKAIVAINPESQVEINAYELRERTALVIEKVFQQIKIDELIIEGGSTASAIFRNLGVKTLLPLKELSPGVIRSKAGEREDLYITLKPGSYKWPKEVGMF